MHVEVIAVSGVSSDLELFHLLTIKDGRVIDLRVFTNRDRARTAAGLRA